MSNTPTFRTLIEMIDAEKDIHQIKLPVSISSLSPVVSKETIDLHYGTLYKNYVKKALAGEGEFQKAGAVLHTLYFEQFQSPKSTNSPYGESKILIDKKYNSFENFKKELLDSALGIQGSGWVYLTTTGSIKTIANHKIIDSAALIIDMWEHAYIIDYGSDKEKYIKEFWKIINWDTINGRLT